MSIPLFKDNDYVYGRQDMLSALLKCMVGGLGTELLKVQLSFGPPTKHYNHWFLLDRSIINQSFRLSFAMRISSSMYTVWNLPQKTC